MPGLAADVLGELASFEVFAIGTGLNARIRVLDSLARLLHAFA
jgi:hypothetical protein